MADKAQIYINILLVNNLVTPIKIQELLEPKHDWSDNKFTLKSRQYIG
jgi:hypothetical protein